MQISRREFLKLGAAGLLAGLLTEMGLHPARAAEIPVDRLGRVAFDRVRSRREPSTQAPEAAQYVLDDLLHITGEIYVDDPQAYNRLWYRLEDGSFIYSGVVQPVADTLNRPVFEMPWPEGALAEVTVPFADSYWKPDFQSLRSYRLYYGSTHWVRETIVVPMRREIWYRIHDDRLRASYYIPARFLRLYTAGELAPAEPDVPDDLKYIVVDLASQRLVAVQDDRIVFSASVATGKYGYETPTGIFRTYFKRGTIHMLAGDYAAMDFDYPGIPWALILNEAGVSLHGTYWHNDYGAVRSHGCINLTPQDARWLYLWTTPVVPPERRYLYWPGKGTIVDILPST